MAVERTIIKATPYEKDGNVVSWDIEMQYEDGEDDTYYSSSFHTSVDSINRRNDEEVFEKKAKGEWTRAEIIALCPFEQWDRVFARQYATVITNPPVRPLPDNAFELPAA